MRSKHQKQLRTMVNSAYDLQQLRIATGNRIVANFYARLGVAPGTKLTDVDKKKMLKQIIEAYKRLTDGAAEKLADPNIQSDDMFQGEPLIDGDIELNMIEHYFALLKQEQSMLGATGKISKVLARYPVWIEILKEEAGIGPAIAGVLIGEYDVQISPNPSKFVAYAGCEPVPTRDKAGNPVKDG